jgi:hypothetical protein
MPTDVSTPVFKPEQVEAMHRAYERACAAMGLKRKATIITDRIAVKIVDFARAGEFDADKLTNLVLTDFDADESRQSEPPLPA